MTEDQKRRFAAILAIIIIIVIGLFLMFVGILISVFIEPEEKKKDYVIVFLPIKESDVPKKKRTKLVEVEVDD